MFSLRKRKLIFIFLILITIFIIIIINFMSILSKSESEVIQAHLGVEEKIYKIYKQLKNNFNPKSKADNLVGNKFIKYLNNGSLVDNLKQLWTEANSWVSETEVYNINHHLGNVLFAIKKAKIIKADLDNRGSQLKFLLTLEGNQKIIFKPKWYEKEEIIEGVVYSGKDRYGSEILAFYLSGLLDKSNVPLSVERIINFNKELLPVASKRFLETTLTIKNKTCVYGTCYYCVKSDPVCEDSNNLLYGAAIFNLEGNFKIYKSPWRRIYKKGKLADWQINDDYCKIVSKTISQKRILDFVDISIFDFLIQNGDRHHYEVLNGNTVWLDNGKGLGNPNVDHIDILAPLYQCCQVRATTWKQLQLLSGGVLTKKLKLMPDIHNFVGDVHFDALERRLSIVHAAVKYCLSLNKGKNNIL